jgi:ribosomal protein L10
MNKAKLKKYVDTKKVFTLLNNSSFLGFFCMQNIAVKEKIQLKKDLERTGFEYKLLKNAVIFKTLFKSLPELRGILSGSLAILYAKEPGSVDFLELKNAFSILEKSKNAFFLGGQFEGKLINNLFEKKVNSLEDQKTLQIQQVSILQGILTDIIKTTSHSKNTLSFILSRKANQS